MMKERLTICDHDFKIENNKLKYCNAKSDTYKFTKNNTEIFQKIVEDNFDDYYLEKIYKYIQNNFDDSDRLLKGTSKTLKYTDRIKKVIANCAKNPLGDTENMILNLFSIYDISWLPYIEKLDKLYENSIIIKALECKELPDKYISGGIYKFDNIIITFHKYSFDLSINFFDNMEIKRKAMINIDQIPEVNLLEYDISDAYIILNNQKYKIFDNVLDFLQKLAEY